METTPQSVEDTVLPEGEERFFEEEMQPFRPDKLYDARTLSGESNHELFAVVRDIESRLANIPEFIGLAPFGSHTKGYGAENSDFDMYVLLDAPSHYLSELDAILNTIKEEYEKKGTHLSFNKELIRSTASGTPDMDISESTVESIEPISVLSRVVTGHKVDLYRDLVKAKVEKMYPLKKTAFFANIIRYLTDRDTNPLTLSKMEDRASEPGTLPAFNKEDYQTARQELWTKRVHKLFGE